MKAQVLFLFILFTFSLKAQVAINSDNSAPDNSAMLDIKSTDSGLLIPRMTTDERDNISSPATGLVVYVTEDANANPVNTFYYFDGTAWVPFQQGGKAWLLEGNAGTDGSQFVGTTDAQPLILKTNNLERIHIKDNGVIGVNVQPNDDYLIYAESDAHNIIGRFINTKPNYDGIAVYGDASTTDFYGYGGVFKSGYRAVQAEVSPTGSGFYYGVLSSVSGGSGSNYGIYAGVSGTGNNYGITSNASGGNNNYAFFSVSDIEDGKGSIAYFANTNDTGSGIFALGSNVSSYYRMQQEGAAISATGKKFTITGHSNNDDSQTIVILGQYEGTDNYVDATGVQGYSVPRDTWGYGVKGIGGWRGVYGEAQNGNAGVYGSDSGNSSYGVYSNGELGASGTKSFAIDHPLDPANKILKHFSIESNEVLNVYRGNVILDAQGKAEVQLPSYFHAVNKNFSYTLTPVGSPSPEIYIASEIDQNGRFSIAGGQAGQKISWYVYAERNDPYLQQYPEKRQVEVLKNEREKGKYLRPELYGQPAEKGIDYQPAAGKINSKKDKANTRLILEEHKEPKK